MSPLVPMFRRGQSAPDATPDTVDSLLAELEHYGHPTLYRHRHEYSDGNYWHAKIEFLTPAGLSAMAKVPTGTRPRTALEALQIVRDIIRKEFEAAK